MPHGHRLKMYIDIDMWPVVVVQLFVQEQRSDHTAGILKQQ